MNHARFRGVFFILGFLAAAAGCRKANEAVVARVGRSDITLSDLKTRLQETPAAYQQYVATPDGRRQFLNLLIRERILMEQARQAGLERDETYRKTVDQYKAQWERRLKDFKESLLVESYLRQLRSKDLAVTDIELQRYFSEHQTDYQTPVEMQTSHILVRTPQEADAALMRLRKGEPFEKLARELSMDPATAAKGGKLSPFRRGQLVPEFEEAAAKLSTGQVSGVVKTTFGYHIIKKLGQTKLPPRAFADVKDEIRSTLERAKFEQWVTRTQSSMGVTVNDQTLAALSVPPAPGPQEVHP